ncbi:MAG: sigma-54 dependent transcriptional regulator [Bdellovibrionota bacterium]
MSAKIVILEKDNKILEVLKGRLEQECLEVTIAKDASYVRGVFSKEGQDIGVLLLELDSLEDNGPDLNLISWVREKYPCTCTIAITDPAHNEMTIQALKRGTSDYVKKPLDPDEISLVVKRGIREYWSKRIGGESLERLEARVKRVEGRVEDRFWFVTKSPAMDKVNEQLNSIRREAMRGIENEPPVLISGDIGTGKEGIARMIHAGSRRGKGPWVTIYCANYGGDMLDAEMFGHEHGAVSGVLGSRRGALELAYGGTLFIDEIATMDAYLQEKLLRTIKQKAFRRIGGSTDIGYDARIIATFSGDLDKLANDGKFSRELLHYLGAIMISMPSLKARSDDIISVAKHFSERAFRFYGKIFAGFAPDAEVLLKNHDWPGNLRELYNVIEHAALLSPSGCPVTAADLYIKVNLSSVADTNTSNVVSLDRGSVSYTSMKKKWCATFEKEYLMDTLARHGGNVSSAAREAQLDRSNFLRLLRKYGLRSQEFRKAA